MPEPDFLATHWFGLPHEKVRHVVAAKRPCEALVDTDVVTRIGHRGRMEVVPGGAGPFQQCAGGQGDREEVRELNTVLKRVEITCLVRERAGEHVLGVAVHHELAFVKPLTIGQWRTLAQRAEIEFGQWLVDQGQRGHRVASLAQKDRPPPVSGSSTTSMGQRTPKSSRRFNKARGGSMGRSQKLRCLTLPRYRRLTPSCSDERTPCL
jgi:hypothetical protein